MPFHKSSGELPATESAAVIFMVSGHTSDFDDHWERAESKRKKMHGRERKSKLRFEIQQWKLSQIF